MDMWDANKQEQLFAWLRYLYWADLARQDWDGFAESEENIDECGNLWGYFARMSHFYATEYVVIEGWREAKFSDSVINEVLNRWPDLLDLLRRYRNGVFHYQPQLVEPRFTELLKESENAIPLVYYLHSEFCRYYWNYFDSLPGSPEQRFELRDSLLHIVGWLPEELIEAKAAKLRQLANEAVMLTQGHEGPQAEDLRSSAVTARFIAERQVVKYREMCRAFLSRSVE
jgi:hypothetical protein